jgi:tRNA(fMet)-specific endonuclease VapC
MEGLILLDTCMLFDFLVDTKGADRTERILGEGKGAVSSITVYEIFRGVESEKHLEQRSTLLSYLHVLDLTAPVARKGAGIFTRLKKQGLLVPHEDILIGATAVHYNIPLLTGDIEHFENIRGLRFYPV